MKKLAMTFAMALILSAMPIMAQTDTTPPPAPTGGQPIDEATGETSSIDPIPDGGQEEEPAAPAN